MTGVLHFRIFDADGKVVVDKDEKSLTTQPGPIADLKGQPDSGLWPPHELTRSEKGRVIAAVTSIVGHTRSHHEGSTSANLCSGPGPYLPLAQGLAFVFYFAYSLPLLHLLLALRFASRWWLVPAVLTVVVLLAELVALTAPAAGALFRRRGVSRWVVALVTALELALLFWVAAPDTSRTFWKAEAVLALSRATDLAGGLSTAFPIAFLALVSVHWV